MTTGDDALMPTTTACLCLLAEEDKGTAREAISTGHSLQNAYAMDPSLNDGALLNIMQFYWDVVPWKEANAAWQQLRQNGLAR
jgi:hypothetical protein